MSQTMTTTMPKDREEFLRGRLGVGSSEAGAVLGRDRFETPRDVYDRLVMLHDHGELPPESESYHVERGQDLEPVAARRFTEQTGLKLMKQSKPDRCPELPYLLSNPDRVIVGQQELAEIKSPAPHTVRWIKENGMPASWSIQGQAQLACRPNMTAVRYVIQNVDPWETIVLPPIERHEDYIREVLLPGVQKFWLNHFEPRIPPEEPYEEYETPPAWDGEVVTMDSPEWEEAVAKLQKWYELEGKAKDMKKEARAEVEELMGDIQVAAGSGVKINWKWSDGRARLDKKMVDRHLLDFQTALKRVLDRAETADGLPAPPEVQFAIQDIQGIVQNALYESLVTVESCKVQGKPYRSFRPNFNYED